MHHLASTARRNWEIEHVRRPLEHGALGDVSRPLGFLGVKEKSVKHRQC
jgi:hypothetical protein